MSSPVFRQAWISLFIFLAASELSIGQSPPQKERKWEIEVHAGPLVHYGTNGSGQVLPTAPQYAVFIDPLLFNSRKVSSWYYGAGAQLFDGAALREGPAIRPVVPPIVPLDPVLTSSVVKPEGGDIGFRISRQISRWAAVELSVERAGRLSLSKGAQATIQASRDSFTTALQEVAPGPVTSQSVINDRGGHFIFSTASLLVNTPHYGRVRPFLSAGLGMLSTGDSGPRASLAGSYDTHLQRISVTPDVIFDTVGINYASANHRSPVFSVGGGIKIPIKSRWGLRVDARAYLYHDPTKTLLSSAHTEPHTFAFIVNDGPGSTQFVDVLPPGTIVGAPPGSPSVISSLEGPPLTGFNSFRETGIQSQFHVSIGPFWRF